MPQAITEKDGIHKQWYEEAKKISLAEWPAFAKRLLEDYDHDYGTICHAITAIMLAAGHGANAHPNAGITGFQASCIMWEFIQKWMHKEGPMRLVEYGDLLYPQYDDKFRSISPDTHEWLKERAQKMLTDNGEMLTDNGEMLTDNGARHIHPDVLERWRQCAGGYVPAGLIIRE